MSPSQDLVDFDRIEGQKENIQSLPGGRSAKKLAELYSPSPLHKLATPTPTDTRNINDCIRTEYEVEVASMAESDDPLDIFDRYVRWTLDAYPSAQATPQSQLHTLLERATKAFVSSPQYKNDPRYLKLWMYYIQFFSDAPRETYLFLSRHGIGENLALFYEEYSSWLESASRWSQAEEVYKLGIEREARPVARLVRKFGEFEARRAQLAQEPTEPSSPALPTVRPALAAKVDPFGAPRSVDPQAQRQPSAGGSKAAKSKLTIFSDADAKPPALAEKASGPKGWDTIGSLADRKKENTVEAKPWVGETLKAGGKKASADKMAVFRDPSLSKIRNIVVVPSQNQVTVHPQTGKRERIYVDLAMIYPTPEDAGTELSFEEIMAANRGWLDHTWSAMEPQRDSLPEVTDNIEGELAQKLVIHRDVVTYDENGAAVEPAQMPRNRKQRKAMEVNETQIIKAKLDSPSGPKLRKKNQSEPTMTIHTKAATDDIYDIFNAPLKSKTDEESGDEDYMTDGDYTTDGESTGTARQVEDSDQGEDGEDGEDDEASDAKSVSEWSDFSTRRHVPDVNLAEDGERTDVSDLMDPALSPSVQRKTDHGEVDGANRDEEDEVYEQSVPEDEPRTRTVFIPVPPEDYEPPTRPFRDPAEVANNRLPFMTPITERTEVSLEVDLDRSFRTPSRGDRYIDHETDYGLEPMSSPLRDVTEQDLPVARIPVSLATHAKPSQPAARPKGPVIKEAQCNPVEDAVRCEILDSLHPPLNSFTGFFDHREERYERAGEIRKFIKSQARVKGSDRTSHIPEPVRLSLSGPSTYYVRRELGSGAFAPVYLVENPQADEAEDDDGAPVSMGKGAFAVRQRSALEALKMETPPTPWEFYMMRLAHARVGPQHRASASLSCAHEMHLYQDEAFLFLPYHPHGTLLDVVNLFRTEQSGVMDEQLAMFFTIELLRTVEVLHSKSILHGDLKADNCLLRLDALGSELSSQWQADGRGGWSTRGVTLIDFGRGIDMRNFLPDVEFIADWKTTSQDCAEMREGRPWTWQIDYHGLASIIHCLLFGKYIETQRADQAGAVMRGQRRYRIRESLKRYWQTELWAECFDLLLNPAAHVEAEEGRAMPVLASMRGMREKMEGWLSQHCEKGVGLKFMVARLEEQVKSRK